MSRRPSAAREAYLDRVLIGGREPAEIVIADHDPAWAERFAVERDRIATALGGVVRRIEHVGSTSVPGLAAKPIVDIVVTVPEVDDEAAYAAALRECGYTLRVREAGHRMFRTSKRDVHVHVHGDGDDEVTRFIVFRDRLRCHPEERRWYERVKRDLATRPWSDMNDYADAKGRVIATILQRGMEAR